MSHTIPAALSCKKKSSLNTNGEGSRSATDWDKETNGNTLRPASMLLEHQACSTA